MTPSGLPQDWPFRAAARMIRTGRQPLWLIDTGPPDAPALLLLHGTGASGHSFRRTIPGLALHYRVLVPDLPGHGCSAGPYFDRLGLDDMAADLSALCDHLSVRPRAIIGHSAGAAIALRMADTSPPPAGVIGINAALGEFDGAAGVFFPLFARALASLPLAAGAIAALFGRAATVDRILAGTGSPLDPAGRAMYLRLVRDPDHITGSLAMMAQWRLQDLLSRLPVLNFPIFLIASEGDRAVPPKVSVDAAARMPSARLSLVPRLGHLAHEEAADGLSGLILDHLGAR